MPTTLSALPAQVLLWFSRVLTAISLIVVLLFVVFIDIFNCFFQDRPSTACPSTVLVLTPRPAPRKSLPVHPVCGDISLQNYTNISATDSAYVYVHSVCQESEKRSSIIHGANCDRGIRMSIQCSDKPLKLPDSFMVRTATMKSCFGLLLKSCPAICVPIFSQKK